jgi:hypothetical protein
MSQATLKTTALPELGPEWRRVVVDCPHASTSISYANGDRLACDDETMARVVLVQHYTLEDCTCIRKLWRCYWHTALGELPLVRAEAPP